MQLNDALTLLEAEVAAEDSLEARQAAIEVARASLDFHLRHRPPAEIDRARFELWARQILIDAEEEEIAAVSGDVTTLEWTLARFAHTLSSADEAEIETLLDDLRTAVEEEDFSAATTAAGALRYIVARAVAGVRLDIAICAPTAGPFSTTISHPFYPLPEGATWKLEGEEDGAQVELRITSLADTELVAGVSTRVIEERALIGGELHEVARNFLVRAVDGTLCYYGEDVDFYENGEIVSHEGAWRVGVNGALPGIFMPAIPMEGQVFQQELAPGISEDEAVIVATGKTVVVPLASFSDTIEFLEYNPLDRDLSTKIFARGAGLIVADEFKRVVD